MVSDEAPSVPMGVLLVASGDLGDHLLFMHPYKAVQSSEPAPRSAGYNNKHDQHDEVPRPVPQGQHSTINPREISYNTQYGISTDMLATILIVKAASCDQPFEMKVDNVRFAGYPKSVSNCDECSSIFSIIFVLPANVDSHIVEAFQILSKKLALSIDALQTMNSYFRDQEREIRRYLDDYEQSSESERSKNPWESISNKNKLANMLTKVFEDVGRTGVVQIFVDDFIEVGFCVESLAFKHAHLTPKNRSEVDQLVRMIRPYHGILLLEHVWPTPDGNPSVTLLLKHCESNRSILDISTSSGIPLLQVFLIVRHLLLWARAVVIYPLANTNIYTSATREGPLGKPIERFKRLVGPDVHLASALAHFNPPATLSTFVDMKATLPVEQAKVKVVEFLLRHQLLMQLHKFCYILLPYSDAELPRSGRHCPKALKADINAASDLPESVRSIVCDICGQLLETNGLATVTERLSLFLRMSPFLHGKHHVEDIIYRLNEDRKLVEDALDSFALVLSTFLRPDFIAE